MNKKLLRLICDILLASIVTVVVYIALIAVNIPYIGLAIVPLVWLSLRHGWTSNVIASLISGIVVGFISLSPLNIAIMMIIYVVPFIVTAISGFFAKNTQKTLNNRRYNSTYLNIATAIFVSALLFNVMRHYVVPNIMNTVITITLTSFMLHVIIITIIGSTLLCILAKFMPKFIIPKRTKYLTRKETSSLLND